MQKEFHLVLRHGEVFQLLDGLEIREQSWRDTAQYLTTGEMGGEFFLIEECSDPEEATNIANDYRKIIDRIRNQITAQQTAAASPEYLTRPKEGTGAGYAIYIDTFLQGPVAVERDENNKPVTYPTERAAHCKIAESTIIRLEQFLAGERDFEDATTIEESIGNLSDSVATTDLFPASKANSPNRTQNESLALANPSEGVDHGLRGTRGWGLGVPPKICGNLRPSSPLRSSHLRVRLSPQRFHHR